MKLAILCLCLASAASAAPVSIRRPPAPNDLLHRGVKLAEATFPFAFHVAVLLPLPATPIRHQATGDALTGKYEGCALLRSKSILD